MSAVPMETIPFDSTKLAIDVSLMSYVEIPSTSVEYNIVIHYISANLEKEMYPYLSKSYRISYHPSHKKEGHCFDSLDTHEDEDEDKDEEDKNVKELGLTIGLGFFAFRDMHHNIMFALNEAIGAPVGSSCGIERLEKLILFSQESEEQILQFISYLIKQSQKVKPKTFIIYKWQPRQMYWRNSAVCNARSLESVILPTDTKKFLLDDMNKFLDSKTRSFYYTHGIPYRRSYLFYGVPGAGKTSFIQALAGHFRRNISILQPTHPDITDDSLHEAISCLDRNTIVVIEDIDALFAKNRSSKMQSKITFSGLLNALDGVGNNSTGQIYILTTNLRDQLDPALIRKGRVDIHIKFSSATSEQMKLIWNSFYPQDTDKAEVFVQQVEAFLQDEEISTSGLQHFFVMNMYCSAEEALASIPIVLHDIIQNNDTTDEKKEKGSKKEGSNDGSNKDNSIHKMTEEEAEDRTFHVFSLREDY